ncbi:MAG: hypothetical protein IKJ73_10045 [Lachnospiraceae bacterium]|nr:hypothetical protein [Lachnospiraceae bacterium]
MICESCKFDNREGALFCAECGKPLASANANAEKPEVKNEQDDSKTVILDEVVTNSKESVDKEDESEANTTVLTSDMLKPAQPAAPKGFAPGPAPVKPMAPQAPKMAAPQGAPMAPNGQPMAPQAPKMAAPQGAPMAPNGQPMAPQAPKMAAPQGAPMAPNGQPMAPQAPKMAAPQGAPMAPNGQPAAPQAPANGQPATPQAPANGQPVPAAPADKKPAKVDKKEQKKAAKAAKKEKKGKMGVGTKVYIVISILLILGLGGTLAYGYFIFHKDKMADAKTEKETLITDYEAQLSQKDNEIANLYASSTDAQATIASLETQLADSQLAQAEAQATADSYTAYDPLINFVESCSADSSTDMMVSDTVVYATAGSTVEVYVYFPSQEGQLSYVVSDVAVVDCTWGEEWVNGNVLPISIEAKSAGDVTIEVTNDQNDIKETIFVHVE